jgi:hypothetical protein
VATLPLYLNALTGNGAFSNGEWLFG